jgi:hypothetical protein
VFETVDSPGPFIGILRYFIQLFLSYPVVMLTGIPFFALLPVLGLSGEHFSHIYFAGYRALVCIFVGSVVGWGVGRKVPSLMATGRWIWLLPAVIVFPDMVREGITVRPVPNLSEYLFATGGEGDLGVYLFTLPTFSALGYSIGVVLVDVKARWINLNRLRPGWRVVTIMLACVALFSVLATVARQFEHSKIQTVSSVRMLIDDLWLTPDASLVCSGSASKSGIHLTGAVMVESLERGICGKDKLLDADAERPAGSWVIERVRVLSGANTGAEGWVLSYGLLQTFRP